MAVGRTLDLGGQDNCRRFVAAVGQRDEMQAIGPSKSSYLPEGF